MQEVESIDFLSTTVVLEDGDRRDIEWNHLMQYTWMTDKNSVEIYEGDIVYVDWYVDWFAGKREVLYHKWAYIRQDSWWGDRNIGNNIKDIKVIWNIYENPELLSD